MVRPSCAHVGSRSPPFSLLSDNFYPLCLLLLLFARTRVVLLLPNPVEGEGALVSLCVTEHGGQITLAPGHGAMASGTGIQRKPARDRDAPLGKRHRDSGYLRSRAAVQRSTACSSTR
ncbi:hypothetical protein CGRA01v4_05272 [Colletotrichum graminicola]|nr:hypothetical protein CGRA01v4_05272 [Colletotrichum graminicola]